MADTSVAPLISTTTYELRGVTIVPHYTVDGVYVGPGGVQYSATQLIRKGATRTQTMLWPRARAS